MSKKFMLNDKIKEYLDRWAISPKRPHSYLFFGQKGAEQKEAAYYFIEKLLSRERDAELLKNLKEKNHPDVIFIKPELIEDKKGRTREKEITIDQIRKAQEQLKYFPYELQFKFCLVEKAERLNQEAANALLKGLEEPTEKTFYILLASSVDALLPTIVSRCASLRFPEIELPAWKEENRERLRKVFVEELYEKFSWAEKISKNRNDAIEMLKDWENVMSEGMRKMMESAGARNFDRIKKTAAMLMENREAINRIEHTNANPRIILEKLLLGLQWMI
jgi:DNA polymerase III delta prime subunit